MIICGVEAITIVNTFGRGMIINSLSYSANSVLKSISYLTGFDQPRVKEVVSELCAIDLEYKITLTQKLIKELNMLDNGYESETIDYALEKLNEQVESISKDLDTIKSMIETHNKKYFQAWKTLNCASMISSIRKKKVILDDRYDELLELLKLRKLLSAEKMEKKSIENNKQIVKPKPNIIKMLLNSN